MASFITSQFLKCGVVLAEGNRTDAELKSFVTGIALGIAAVKELEVKEDGQTVTVSTALMITALISCSELSEDEARALTAVIQAQSTEAAQARQALEFVIDSGEGAE